MLEFGNPLIFKQETCTSVFLIADCNMVIIGTGGGVSQSQGEQVIVIDGKLAELNNISDNEILEVELLHSYNFTKSIDLYCSAPEDYKVLSPKPPY